MCRFSHAAAGQGNNSWPRCLHCCWLRWWRLCLPGRATRTDDGWRRTSGWHMNIHRAFRWQVTGSVRRSRDTASLVGFVFAVLSRTRRTQKSEQSRCLGRGKLTCRGAHCQRLTKRGESTIGSLKHESSMRDCLHPHSREETGAIHLSEFGALLVRTLFRIRHFIAVALSFGLQYYTRKIKTSQNVEWNSMWNID